MKKMEMYTFLLFVCVKRYRSVCVHACVCVRARVKEFVYMYVCDVSVCHRVSSFPFTAP